MKMFKILISIMVYVCYTIPTLFLGIRDGFFIDQGHIIITIGGGLATLLMVSANITDYIIYKKKQNEYKH